MIPVLRAQLLFVSGVWFFCVTCPNLNGQFHIDLEKDPFNYTKSEADNRVTRLITVLDAQKQSWEYSSKFGYLKSLLSALVIDQSSQTLVFSKTSLQVRYISRSNPRAIYFNDDTYVGWVHGSKLVEISTVDPVLGAAFYTFDMDQQKPLIRRSNYDCLGCHATSMTQGVPGHLVRSVFPTYDGNIDLHKATFLSDDSSPFDERWGGWYVTGHHGNMKHMGNTIVRAGELDIQNNGNRVDLKSDFNTNNYIAPQSDIVALMVLEHQSQMHNALTRAGFVMRQFAYDQNQLGATGKGAEEVQPQVQLLAKDLVDRLLFVKEFQLTSEVTGSKEFARDFQDRGPRDSQNRSLREFDLKTRLFKYPCSYLIYSASFNRLPQDLRDQVFTRLIHVLKGRDSSREYAHLTSPIRQAILEILRETDAGFQKFYNEANDADKVD